VPVVGQLQARRERRRGLQVSGEVAEDVVGELGSVCVGCRMLSVVLCLVLCVVSSVLCCASSPAAGEFTFLL
jgi:uncharacterized protein (DUF697 family)